MNDVIIDASVAIKWVAPEAMSEHAVALLDGPRLAAPDLLVAECANILWKKKVRGEMDADTAILAAQAMERVDIELVPTRPLFAEALRLAIELDHPAYDCIYLALALARDSRFITADERLVRKLTQGGDRRISDCVLALQDARDLVG